MNLLPEIRSFPVLGLWRTNTMSYAGTMAFYRDFASILSTQYPSTHAGDRQPRGDRAACVRADIRQRRTVWLAPTLVPGLI